MERPLADKAAEIKAVARALVKVDNGDPDAKWPRSGPLSKPRWEWRVKEAAAAIAALDASRAGGG